MDVGEEFAHAVGFSHFLVHGLRIIHAWRFAHLPGHQIQGYLRFALAVIDRIDRTLEGLQAIIDVLKRSRLLDPCRPRNQDIRARGKLRRQRINHNRKFAGAGTDQIRRHPITGVIASDKQGIEVADLLKE